MGHYHQGKFTPNNPKKYRGDPTNIIYRSSWELKLCRYLDRHPKVLEWASEEFWIPYRSPFDKSGRSFRRYFPDFWVRRIDKHDNEEILVIEVKPETQSKPPRKPKDNRGKKRYLREQVTWGINRAKWKYAEEYCKQRGWKFEVFTERELGIK